METLEPPPQRTEWAKFLMPLAFLFVMACVLGTLLVLMVTHFAKVVPATEAAKAERQGMIRLALVCAVLLGLTLVVMFWMIVRFVGLRVRPPVERPATKHVDAWSLAGQRLKLSDEELPEEPGEDKEPGKD
jgi:uncharacterized BrkB/YihY/UPF0761 family membrane protein